MIDRQKHNLHRYSAKKRFGQNFLKDERFLHQIIESMPHRPRRVVEIGPGLGDLTRFLVENKDVTAYEVDKELCGHLRKRFAASIQKDGLKLICGDVLRHWETGSLEKQPYLLVANLPYYIATKIVLQALKDVHCQSLLVMVQKEVAEKFAAKPGEKAFSALAVLANTAGDVRRCFDVPPDAFEPAPKVMSSVLRIDKHVNFDDAQFEAFLKVAFTQPRKTLVRNLSASFAKHEIADALQAMGLPPAIRPHEVATSLYHRLYKQLKGDIDGREEGAGQQTRRQQSNKPFKQK